MQVVATRPKASGWQAVRDRSSVLKRAGHSSFEPGAMDVSPTATGVARGTPPSPGTAGRRASAPADHGAGAGLAEADAPQPCEDSAASCGLTPASLKHLRRQNTKLTGEKELLKAEVSGLQAQLREEQGKVSSLQLALAEVEARQAQLQQDIAAGLEREDAQDHRIQELLILNAKQEESLSLREAEVLSLKKSLEEQRELTREVCRAADRQASIVAVSGGEDRERQQALEKQNDELRRQLAALSASAANSGELERLRRENEALRSETEALKASMGEVAGAAKQAMLLSAAQMDRVNKIRNGALADAINRKIELHVSVPRVSLTYNNAPPLQVSLATFLSQDRISSFMDREVFPHFEPLWMRVDELDQAPDGSSKKVYCTRMLDMLTQSIKGFIMKAQATDDARGDNGELPPLTRIEASAATAAPEGGADRTITPLGMSGPIRTKSRSSTSASSPASDLAEGDRERLLELLKSGDDRALDGKLKQLLGKS